MREIMPSLSPKEHSQFCFLGLLTMGAIRILSVYVSYSIVNLDLHVPFDILVLFEMFTRLTTVTVTERKSLTMISKQSSLEDTLTDCLIVLS